MTGIRSVICGALGSFACLCVPSVVDARAIANERVRTNFGYVEVDPLDVEKAIAEGRAAADAAERHLLLPKVHIAIVEEGAGGHRWGSTFKGYVVYPWPFPNGSRRNSARPATHVLRHEIGHDLLERYVIPNSRKNQYGTDAPDWLDELVAIAFEGIEQQANRRRTAKREIARGSIMLPSRILSMEHPEFQTAVVLEPNTVIGTMNPTSNNTISFYSSIQAIYDFLISQRGEDDILPSLIAEYLRHGDLKAWIVSSIFPDKVGSRIEDVDAVFLSWLSGDCRYDDQTAINCTKQ